MSGGANGQLKDALSEVIISVRTDLHVSRHLVRGAPRYVIRDSVRFRSHSLCLRDYRIFMALNNQKRLGEIFARLVDEKLLAAGSEEQFYTFIVSLNQRGLLNLPITDPKRLYQRFEAKRLSKRRRMLTSILCFQLPLWNPSRFLDRTSIYSRLLFSRLFFVCWLVALIASLSVIAVRWDEFSSSLASILALQNAVLIVCLIVGLKAWHEFGHAFACRFFGGTVPEMGALFIVGAPCAYVDASAAWGFPNRWHRVVVNLAGMYFESMIAIVAVFVWSFTTASYINSVAHYTVLVSTVITLAFNLNPLMRFDGYYVASDALNMPNLRQESVNAVHQFLKRLALGLPASGGYSLTFKGVALLIFGVASMAYKVIVMLGICAVVAYRVPAIGLGVGAIYLGHTCLANAKKVIQYLVTHAETKPVRRRAIAVAVLLVGGIPLVGLALPVSRTVTLAGVAGREIEQVIRAEAPGFLIRKHAEIGDQVRLGEVVATLHNPDLVLKHLQTRTEFESLSRELRSALSVDRSEAQQIEEQLTSVAAEWKQLSTLVAKMEVASPHSGQIIESPLKRRSGQFLSAGRPLMTVSGGEWVVRAVASAEQLAVAKPEIGEDVDVCFVHAPGQTVQAEVLNVAEIGSRRLEYTELTHLGGGTIAVNATDMKASESYFEITLKMPPSVANWLRHRARAYVCFRHRPRTLANLVYTRSLQFYHRFLRG